MPARCCLLFRLHYLLRCNALVVCILSPCCRLSPCLAAPTTLADDDKNVLWVLAPSLSNSRPPFTHLHTHTLSPEVREEKKAPETFCASTCRQHTNQKSTSSSHPFGSPSSQLCSSAALQPCRNPGEPDRFPPSNFLSTPAAFFGSEFLVCGSDGWFPRNATFWFAPGRVCRVLCAVLCALLSRPADPRTRGLVVMWREIEKAANSYLLRHVVPTLLCLGACRYAVIWFGT